MRISLVYIVYFFDTAFCYHILVLFVYYFLFVCLYLPLCFICVFVLAL